MGPWGCTPPQHCAPNPNAAAASSCCSEGGTCEEADQGCRPPFAYVVSTREFDADADGKRPRVGSWGCTPPQRCAPNPNAAAASSCCSELPSFLPASVLPSASAAGVQAGVVLTTSELERLQAVKQRIDTELNGGLAAHPFHVRRHCCTAPLLHGPAAARPRCCTAPLLHAARVSPFPMPC